MRHNIYLSICYLLVAVSPGQLAKLVKSAVREEERHITHAGCGVNPPPLRKNSMKPELMLESWDILF